MRLMSDVPLGMFLSGGVDSSAIAALMKRMVPTPVKTFSVGYQRGALQRTGVRAPGRASASAPIITKSPSGMERFLQCAAAAGLARRRADRLALQRVAVFCFEAGGRAGEGGADRRGQRRTVRRLSAGIRYYLFNQRWADRYRHCAGRRCAQRSARSIDSSRAALRRLAAQAAAHRSWAASADIESLYLDNFYSAFSAAEQRGDARRHPGRARDPYANYLRYWNARGAAPAIAACCMPIRKPIWWSC